MKKTVNVHPQGRPITALSLAIRSDMIGAEMEIEDIKKIILQKGAVEEVFPDGTTCALNLSNYADENLFQTVQKQNAKAAEEEKQAEVEAARQAEIQAKKDAAKQAAIEGLKDPIPEKKEETPAPVKVEAEKVVPQNEDAAVKAAREKAIAREKAEAEAAKNKK